MIYPAPFRPMVLPQPQAGKHFGVKKKYGVPFGGYDDRTVAVDPPSPPIKRYRGCPSGCCCIKCVIDREDFEKLMRECRPFAVEASHAPQSKGYRQVRAG